MSLSRQEYVEQTCREMGAIPFALALIADAISSGYLHSDEVAIALCGGGMDAYLSRCLTVHLARDETMAIALLSDALGIIRAERLT